MFFFNTEWFLSVVIYAVYAGVNDTDITQGKLQQTFRKAREVLEAMRRLATERVERDIQK